MRYARSVVRYSPCSAKALHRQGDERVVQQATTRSLEFLQTQREDTRSLETNRERIESQKDTLVNAFDSFALTLSRGQAVGAIVAPADANHLAYLAHQLHGETRAVEAAVHQALTIGPGAR